MHLELTHQLAGRFKVGLSLKEITQAKEGAVGMKKHNLQPRFNFY